MQAYRSKGSRTFRILSMRMRCVFLSSSHHTCVVGFVELLSYKDLQLSNMLGTRSVFISCLKKNITSYRDISTLSRTVSVFIVLSLKYYHVMETRENQSGPAILLIYSLSNQKSNLGALLEFSLYLQSTFSSLLYLFPLSIFFAVILSLVFFFL